MKNLTGRIISSILNNKLVVYLLFIALVIGGFYAMRRIPVDAIPDIGENQTIVFVEWAGRSPRDVEDQVTFPLSTALQGIPGVKEIRSQSAFGFAMIYVIFEDKVDFYFARTRVLEKLNYASSLLPPGVTPTLGPDATGLGQVFWYTVEGEGYNLQQLRSIQDWYIKYALASVPGVSEVASVGGFVKQYQVDVDPNKLFAYNISHLAVINAVKDANIDVGAKVIEANGMEFLIRGVGFIKTVEDIENIVLGSYNGTPIRVKDVAVVQIGPEFRRGVLNKGGKEAVGGVVVMRYRENPSKVIDGVKQKITDITPGLPPGVKIVPFYDRTELIKATTRTLIEAVIVEIIITVAVILAFSLPMRMSFIISLTLPLSVLFAFVLMRLFGIDAHIMSLAGIIIAIGTIVDMGIIMTENIYRNLKEENWRESGKSKKDIVFQSAGEVGRAIMGAILTTIVPFLAILALEGQSAKLFHPVVFTKTFVLIGSLLTAILLLPLLYYDFIVPKPRHISQWLENQSQKGLPRKLLIMAAAAVGFFLIERLLKLTGAIGGIRWANLFRWMGDNIWMLIFSVVFLVGTFFLAKNLKKIMKRLLDWGLRHKWVLVFPLVLFLFSLYLLVFRIQNEFRPPLNEGSFLFMPVLLPSASLNQVYEVMNKQNEILMTFPEVKQVVGKLGRIDSATDPAPVSMIETIINLKPRQQWRKGMTKEKLLHDMNYALDIPGVGNIWTQPIQNRIDMLSTGIQTPVGIKVFGTDLKKIEELVQEIEKVVRDVEGYSDSYAERIIGTPYIEYVINREEIARFGLSIQDIQKVIETAIGGMNLVITVEGRERYPVRVRYLREYRDNLDSLNKLLFITPRGEKIPLSRLADIRVVKGPGMINSENGVLRGIVYLNLKSGTGPVDFVRKAEKLIDAKIKFPKGYYYQFAGDFQNQLRAFNKLKIILPLCLFAIFIILYLSFRSLPQTFIVFTAIPITLSGGVLLLWALGYNMSIAVVVGFVALFGIAVDDGIVVTTYINQLLARQSPRTVEEARELVRDATLKRSRSLFMTSATTILALVPILWSQGQGSEIIRPMAVPSIGGMTIGLITIFVVPLLNSWVLERRITRQYEEE